jgi:hypothetical protein
MSCIISEEGVLRKRERIPVATNARRSPELFIWSSLNNPAMDFVRDERIIGESNRSSANCHPKSEMGTVSNGVAGLTKCVAERNFDCWNVRLHRGRPGVRADFR